MGLMAVHDTQESSLATGAAADGVCAASAGRLACGRSRTPTDMSSRYGEGPPGAQTQVPGVWPEQEVRLP